MTALVVLERGATTTLQDGGRVGGARFGVPRSGPLDALAHRLAALLAGVAPDDVATTVALEVGPHPTRLEARGGAVRLAVAGQGATLEHRGMSDPAPCVVELGAGETCEVRTAGWAYVVPAADVDIGAVLGSRSHHPRSGLGPPLSDGVELPLRHPRPVQVGRRRAPALPSGPLLVTAAPQTDDFGDDARDLLRTGEWRTTSDVDRMGHRLAGPTLRSVGGHDIVSDGIVAGTLQVPGDGRPYVLTADHQTTGGYPKIAVLTPVDLARFVQLSPGDPVRFDWTDVATARARLLAAVDAVDAAGGGPALPLASVLGSSNLVGGVTDPVDHGP